MSQVSLNKKNSYYKLAREIIKPAGKLTVSEWADAKRYIAAGTSPEPGQWRTSRMPFLREPMDAFSDPAVETVVLKTSSQIGKSEVLLNVLGFFAEQEPSTQLVIQPKDGMAKAFSKERVSGMFNESPSLKKRLDNVGLKKTSNTIEAKHYKGGFVAIVGANSPADLSSRPIRILLCDEINQYRDTRDGNAVHLGKQRTQNFYNRKVGLFSTPTTKGASPISDYFDLSDQRFYNVCCPGCGKKFLFRWKTKGVFSVRWDKTKSGIHLPDTAAYYCQHCNHKIRERERDEMTAGGFWLPTTESKIRGYHLNVLYSPFVRYSELAHQWVDIHKKKSKKGLMEFINLKLGEDFENKHGNRETETILNLKDSRPAGQLPDENIVALLAQVDTQDNGFWYEIRAWGYGYMPDSWQVRAGFIPADWSKVMADSLQDRAWRYHPAFDKLREILWEHEYRKPDGTVYPVQGAVIDAMGHKTSEVYQFCKFHAGKIYPLQGMKNRSNTPFKWSKINQFPKTKRTIPGGILLLQLDVNHYKDELSTRLQVAPIDPGAWHMNSESTKAWAAQMCSEYLNEKTNRWECPPSKENHAFDVSVYGLALADVMGIKHIPLDPEPIPKKKKKRASEKTSNPYLNGGG